jgi:Fe-S-cluster containining protein
VNVRSKWRTSGTNTQQSKGCFICLGITQGIPKSNVRPVLLAYVYCTIHRIRRTICQSVRPVGDHRTSALKDNSVCPAFQRTSALKDKSVRPH